MNRIGEAVEVRCQHLQANLKLAIPHFQHDQQVPDLFPSIVTLLSDKFSAHLLCLVVSPRGISYYPGEHYKPTCTGTHKRYFL